MLQSFCTSELFNDPLNIGLKVILKIYLKKKKKAKESNIDRSKVDTSTVHLWKRRKKKRHIDRATTTTRIKEIDHIHTPYTIRD